LVADGFDDAILGYAETDDAEAFVIYDTEKCLNILFENYKKDKSIKESDEDLQLMALEYFYYNTAGAYVGKKTPGFATILKED